MTENSDEEEEDGRAVSGDQPGSPPSPDQAPVLSFPGY